MTYIEMFGVFESEAFVGFADDLLAELNAHVVGVVCVLDNPADHEPGGKFGQHLKLLWWCQI